MSDLPKSPNFNSRSLLGRDLHYDNVDCKRCPRLPRRSVELRVRWRSSDQAYFLTAFSMAPPALARSSGIMTG